MKKLKKWPLSIVFSYFTWGIPFDLKQKEVAVKIPEWKFIANATFYRNTIF